MDMGNHYCCGDVLEWIIGISILVNILGMLVYHYFLGKRGQMLRLSKEQNEKINKLLDTKIGVRKFVSRKELEAIKKALGKTDDIKKSADEKDDTESILKRLDQHPDIFKKDK